MNLKYLISLFWLVALPSFSQENCTVPLPPVLTLVSVQPATGWVDLTWNPSPSGNIAAYIVYEYSEDDEGWMPVDTIPDPGARNYTYRTSATKHKSLRFVVAAYRLPLVAGKPGCPSELSNSLSTILLTADVDTCQAKTTLKWNNYADWPEPVSAYRIFIAEGTSALTPLTEVAGETNSFTITGFNTDVQYCYAVEAKIGALTSGSNLQCITTSMQQPPGWIIADNISVAANTTIDLSFSIDPLSEIKNFVLERGPVTSFQGIGNLVSGNSRVTYTDKNPSIPGINYYRLRALNNCNIPVFTSDTLCNIVLSVNTNRDEVILTWNAPEYHDNDNYDYQVFINTGEGFEADVSTGTSKEKSIKMMDLIYEVTSDEVCFYVVAKERTSQHGIFSQNISSVVCIQPGEGITVPNLFTPNNDLRNDAFRPVLAFTPQQYHLVITDRTGRVLFETHDWLEEWDGAGTDQGVYLWSLRLTTPSGKTITRTGTVTIIR